MHDIEIQMHGYEPTDAFFSVFMRGGVVIAIKLAVGTGLWREKVSPNVSFPCCLPTQSIIHEETGIPRWLPAWFFSCKWDFWALPSVLGEFRPAAPEIYDRSYFSSGYPGEVSEKGL